MSKTVLHIPVYEPAGRDVILSETNLQQHMLIIGATGAGKTVLLSRIIQQLIARPQTGLLIFDPKQDDTVPRVRTLAQEAGRVGDVLVLGPDGDRYVNLFADLRSLADVELMTKRLLLGSGSMGRDNAYWDEARCSMIDAALSLLVVQGKRVTFSTACSFLREWCFREDQTDRVATVIEFAESIAAKASGPEKLKLLQALDTVTMWQSLDHRTRSNILSTLTCAVRPLLSVPASRCFQAYGRRPFDVADVARHGRICIVSFNAATNPALASLFFRVVKSDFFRAVQCRQYDGQALCGVIADEWPLLATADDVDSLATIRSRGCFAVAATQGLSVLDERLGTRLRKALLANFGTVVFQRCREDEVDQFAAIHLGTTKRWVTIPSLREDGNLLSQQPVRIRQEVLVCPPGTLGRLAPHQGFVASTHQQPCDYPLSFIPWFEKERKSGQDVYDPASTAHLKQLLAEHGFKERLNALTFSKAVQLCSEGADRERSLSKTRLFFRHRAVLVPEGLETLPTPWLQGLPGILWSTRRRNWIHLPYMICQAEMMDDLLVLHFAQEPMCEPCRHRNSSWDRIRLKVNVSLYPSRWRPLKPRHAQTVSGRWPEMEPTSDPPPFD